MGRHQRAESLGLISFVCCALVGCGVMYLYLQSAPAFWQLSQRRFMACAAIVAACGVISFVVGYIHRIRMLDVQKGWVHSVRRAFEILAL